MHPFDYHKPTSFEEAFQDLSSPGKVVAAVAGATDLIPRIRDGAFHPDLVVDIKGLPHVRDLALLTASTPGDPSPLFVGAAIRMNELARSDLVRSHWSILADAAASMGNEQVRNRATIGGNICTASPAADTAPALYVLEAMVQIAGPAGERQLPIAKFFTGPKRTALSTGEIVTGLVLPQPQESTIGAFEKLSRRQAGDLSIVSVAALAAPGSGTSPSWRLALGAVSPTPLRAPESEAILDEGLTDESIDRAAAAAYGCCCPIGDIRSGEEYRQAMVINLTRRVIRTVIDRMAAGQLG